MDWTEILVAVIGAAVAILQAYHARQHQQDKKEQERREQQAKKEQERRERIQRAKGKKDVCLSKLSLYTAHAVRDGHANGELEKIEREYRDALNEYLLALES
ncbi:MAG: hypothetical protein LBN05_08850 [Oscillospiraceae bacterium]|nr:hypothetical protein [Oscillospiraceae bacterium]